MSSRTVSDTETHCGHRPLRWLGIIALAAFALMGEARAVSATDYIVLVGLRGTAAYDYATATADGETVFAERRLFRALNKAAELLNQGGSHTVRVMVAAGNYPGKTGRGVWVIPAVDNPEGELIVMGGFNDDFSGRQPFGLPTRLITVRGRDGALLQFTRRTTIGKVVLSGMVFDAGPSNKYDVKANSILKGESRSYPLLSFSQLRTGHLVIADNVFLNGAHGAFEPMIAPMNENTVIDIENNFFLNVIKALKVNGGSSRGNKVATINVRSNSFLMNWPYNPDATSSNVSAVELYHNDAAEQINFDGNIFAYNPGGAFQHDWPEDRMSAIAFTNNLFFMNGALFGKGEAEAGVMAGKFGTNPIYMVLDLYTLEDDLDYEVGGNVAFDPQIPMTMAELQSADSYSVDAQNTVINDVRQFFGLNQDGGTVSIANFAPAITYDPTMPPLPQNEEAKGYGVQVEALYGNR